MEASGAVDQVAALSARLGAAPGVAEWWVGEADLGFGTELVVVVAMSDYRPGPMLREFCAEVLGATVPLAVVVIPAGAGRPLTGDRALEVARRSPDVARFESPRTAAEEAVASIVAALVGLRRVSMSDHFFDVGGDSLRLLELVNAVEDEFGVEVDGDELLHCETLRAMAQVVGSAAGAAPSQVG